MSGRPRHWLIRLYPAAWQQRYGDEMDDLLRDVCGWRDMLDVARAAAIERLFHSIEPGVETMQTNVGSIAVLARKPSAIVPLMMSLIAIAALMVAFATAGPLRQEDEGTTAHVWQLLMAGQLPIIGWFALRWVRQNFRAALPILGLQAVAFVAALLPVWLSGL